MHLTSLKTTTALTCLFNASISIEVRKKKKLINIVKLFTDSLNLQS